MKKKKKQLTKSQEGYVIDLVGGMNKVEAYKKNYKTDNMKDETIRKRAYETFKLPHIKAKYDELISTTEAIIETIKIAVYEKQDAINDLIYLKEKAKESLEADGLKQANSQAFLNAIKELCTINSIYPKKNTDELGMNENQVADDLLSIMEQVKKLGDKDE